MKQTIEIPEGHEIVQDGDVFRVLPIKKEWDFKPGDTYSVMGSDGDIYRSVWADDSIDKARKSFGNAFPTEELAEKAHKLQRRSTRKIYACLRVDPNFEPDFFDESQSKWYPFLKYGEWRAGKTWEFNHNPAYVSTKEKCLEAIEVLKAMEASDEDG